MNDRIKVAEAMGWIQHGDEFYTQDKTLRQFDPFTDANDDYAVLEWMRTHTNHNDFRLAASLRVQTALQYQIGDYFRAALKVIDNE